MCLICSEFQSGRMTVREVKQALREYLSHPELEQLVLDKILDETLAVEQGVQSERV